jgi:RNA polymerase sigma factor (sigma-70 family)
MDVSEEEALIRVKSSNCNDSLKKLISEHSGICFNLVLKYKKYIQSRNCDFQDLLDQKDYFIYKAALQYDGNKNIKFSTWLGNYVKYQCLNCRRLKVDSHTVNDENSKVEIDKKAQFDFFDSQMKKERMTVVQEALRELKDSRIRDIYLLRYFNGKKMTFKNISLEMGISEPTIKKLHKKGKNILFKKIKKNT